MLQKHCRALAVGLVLAAAFGPLNATSLLNAQVAQPSSEQMKRLQERDRLVLEVTKLAREQKLNDAAAAIYQILAIEREVLGAPREMMADLLEQLAGWQEGKAEFHVAGKSRQEVIAIRTKYLGPGHWRVTDARLDLRRTERLGGLNQEQLRELAKAGRLMQQVADAHRKKMYGDAVGPAQQALAIRKELLGKEGRDYIYTLQWLGSLFDGLGKYEEAVPYLDEADEIGKKVLGSGHPRYIDLRKYQTSLQEKLAAKQEGRKDYAAARAAREKVLAGKFEIHGEKHPEVSEARAALKHAQRLERLDQRSRDRLARANALLNQVKDLSGQQKYADAVPIAREALQILEVVLSENDLSTVVALKWLDYLFIAQNDSEAARPYRERIARVHQELLGEHPDTAASLRSLGSMLYKVRDYATAASCYRQALHIYATVRGKAHADYTTTHESLTTALQALVLQKSGEDAFEPAREAGRELLQLKIDRYGDAHWQVVDARWGLAQIDVLEKLPPPQRRQLEAALKLFQKVPELESQGRASEALTLARQFLGTVEQLLGEKNRLTASGLGWVGQLLVETGEPEQARAAFAQAVSILEKVLGKVHPELATVLNNWGKSFVFNDYQKALPLLERASEMHRQTKGDHDPDYRVSLTVLEAILGKLASTSLQRDDLDASRKARQQLLEVQGKLHGDKNWRLAETRVALDHLKVLAGLEPLGRHHLAEADDWTRQAGELLGKGKYQAAFELNKKALDVRKKLLKDQDLQYAESLDAHGRLSIKLGDLAGAELALKEVLAIRQQVLGKDNPLCSDSQFALGRYYSAVEDYPAARKALEDALAINTKWSGAAHWSVTDVRLELAHVNRVATLSLPERTQLAEADRLLQTIDELWRQGRYELALPPARRALDLRRQVLGEVNRKTADVLVWLADLELRAENNLQAARSRYEYALEVYRKLLGPEHPRIADLLSSLGDVFLNLSDPAKAEPKYREASAIYRAARGEMNSDYRDSQTRLANCLGHVADGYQRREDLEKASVAFHEALVIQMRLHGSKSWQVTDARLALNHLLRLRELAPPQRAQLAEATRLRARAHELGRQGNYQGGLEAAQKAEKIYKSLLGEVNPDYVLILGLVSSFHMSLGDYASALSDANRSRDLSKQIFGDEHPGYALSLSALCILYTQLGEPRKASPLAGQAYGIWNKFGTDSPFVYASILTTIAMLHTSLGEYTEAETIYRQCLAIQEEFLPPDHPDLLSTWTALAGLYGILGRYDDAQALHRRALERREKKLGPDHPEVALNLYGLAYLDQTLGNYEGALKEFHRALSIYENHGAPQDPFLANILAALAALEVELMDFVQAKEHFDRALKMQEKTYGRPHPVVATTLSGQALLYAGLGQFDRASRLHEEAFQIREGKLGPDHPSIADSLEGLAAVKQELRDLSGAKGNLQRALEIREARLGGEHEAVATSLHGLAFLSWLIGNAKEGIPSCERALKIRQSKLGAAHPQVANSMILLAILNCSAGRLNEAERRFEVGLKSQEGRLGTMHPAVGNSLNQMGMAFYRAGHYASAEPLWIRSRKIFESKYGKSSIAVGNVVGNLANLYQVTNRPKEALASQNTAMEIDQGNLRRIFGFSAESEMREALHIFTGLDVMMSMAAVGEPDSAVGEALKWTLRRKAIVFDTVSRFREARRLATGDNEFARRVQEWENQRQRLANLALNPIAAKDPAKVDGEMAILRDGIEHLEEELNAALSRRSPAGSWNIDDVDGDGVRKKLPPGSALVEFVRVNPFDFRATGQAASWQPARYYAFVLAADQGPPRMIDLKEADLTDKLVQRLNERLEAPRYAKGEKSLEDQFRKTSQELYDRVFAPLGPSLGPARRVYLAPDGELNRIPFSALVDKNGSYLIEQDYRFIYLSTGRDLLRPHPDKPGTGTFVFAGPDYDVKAADPHPVVAKFKRELLTSQPPAPAAKPPEPASVDAALHAENRLPKVRGAVDKWERLEQAELEGVAAEAAFKRNRWEPVHVIKPKDALEEVFKAIRSPRAMHLGTHGFYLPYNPPDPGKPLPPFRPDFPAGSGLYRLAHLENALLRSGFVLAGANKVAETAAQAVHEDGWVMAEEIALMDFTGTELVVLSACKTGRGDLELYGEGVYGLRRAFLYAGARALVASLFDVPEVETLELMERFYAGLKPGRGRIVALQEAQLNLLRDRQQKNGAAHPFFWAGFVLAGDPD